MLRSLINLRAAVAVPAVAVVLAACQAGSGGSTAPSTAPSTAASAEPTTAGSPSAAESMAPQSGSLVVSSNADLGDFLTDADGNTLYVFLNDSPGKTSCFDTCLDNWPAFTVDAAPAAGDGVTGEIGTIERDDGSTQVTLEGWPLYYFAGDAAPGDTNGQGIGNVWFVARPDGSVPAAQGSGSLY